MRAAIAAVVISLALAAAAFAAEASIVGMWYEEATYGGSRVISVVDIRADGTYTGLYRRCLDQGPQDSITNGRWTYEGRRLRFAAQSGAVDDYVTESNDGRIWVYRAVAGTGFDRWGPVRFRDIRVTRESKLPTCDTIS